MSAPLATFHPDNADQHWMQAALAQADLALPHCPPNPAVGCVIVPPQGQGIAQGYTQPVGQAHAEVMALRQAARQGLSVAGSTVYVTLEPCAHTGRTGPCVDALLAHHIGRIVIACIDPNPLVSGKSVARLRAAGVHVDVLSAKHPQALQARDQMCGFFSRMERARPWLRWKTASSLDGQVALPNGQSQWITGLAARADGQRWRARASAILSGIGTVLVDDPLLNVRLDDVLSRQPLLVIADRQLRTPPTARLWQVPQRQVVLAYVDDASAAPSTTNAAPALQRRALALQQQGAQLLALAPGPDYFAQLLAYLHSQTCNEVHIECGPRLGGALLQAHCLDEILAYIGPRIIGPGRALAALPTLEHLAQAPTLHAMQASTLGDSVRLRAWFQPRA